MIVSRVFSKYYALWIDALHIVMVTVVVLQAGGGGVAVSTTTLNMLQCCSCYCLSLWCCVWWYSFHRTLPLMLHCTSPPPQDWSLSRQPRTTMSLTIIQTSILTNHHIRRIALQSSENRPRQIQMASISVETLLIARGRQNFENYLQGISISIIWWNFGYFEMGSSKG